jgi:L-iditol 2-dehydrogenase
MLCRYRLPNAMSVIDSCSYPTTMLAARLHGPRDLRVEQVPHCGPPGPGDVLLRVSATGICGSDLHSYQAARIGDTPIQGPLVLGHEFSARVEQVDTDSLDGNFEPLQPGMRVAVDPAQPCGRCDLCEQGYPNLCRRLHFCGNYPDGGSLCEWMHMPARSCFPVPDSVDNVQAALLEPLGVALHGVDLAKVRVGQSAAVIGAGPIGLLILQVLKLSGADPIFITDKLGWRLRRASDYGGVPIEHEEGKCVSRIASETAGRGVNVVIEAAWGDRSVEEGAEMACLGGRLVVVGISGEDRFDMKQSTARRKGLTILMSRRMKHTYPRAIRLAKEGRIDLLGIVSHRFPLRQAAEVFGLNAAYQQNVVKAVIES